MSVGIWNDEHIAERSDECRHLQDTALRADVNSYFDSVEVGPHRIGVRYLLQGGVRKAGDRVRSRPAVRRCLAACGRSARPIHVRRMTLASSISSFSEVVSAFGSIDGRQQVDD